MSSFSEALGLEHPVIQAGMGGELAGHALAAAVSEAGGLGTIGMLDAEPLRGELERARERTRGPLALNILLPFARSEHWTVADQADVVVTFWGEPVRRTSRTWIHQCGSVPEAKAARAAGADAVIAQGVEAGGHVRGTTRGIELLGRILQALPGCPVILAGGIATADDVRQALDAGAAAVVAGTKFLMSDESGAHPEYKRRLLDADRTVLTDLFGFGWPALHRVVPNAATDRWLRPGGRVPVALRVTHHASALLARRLPLSTGARIAEAQRLAIPLFGPAAPLASSPAAMVELAPLYAGETVARIHEIKPAGELVRELAGG